MASPQPPYEDAHKARNNHRRTRLNALRAMSLSSHLNGSAFALLYVSPVGEIETFSTPSLRPHLGSWFNIKVRKEAKRSAIKYFRTRRHIQGEFAIANDFRGEYDVEEPEAPTKTITGKPRWPRSRTASARAIVEDDWGGEDSPMLGAETALVLPPLEPKHATESGANQASAPASRERESPPDAGSAANTHLRTPGPMTRQNRPARSPSSAGARPTSSEGGFGQSPAIGQPGLDDIAATGRRDLDAQGRPTPPLSTSTSPAELDVTLSQASTSPRPPPCRLVPTLLDPQSISKWYLGRFSAVPHEQQYELCALWIRALEPDHKVKFPYKTSGSTLQPAWWPAGVPHKPPSRLSETERTLLLEAMIHSHDRPLYQLEEMTAQDSFAISLELDYLLNDIYKVVKLQRRGQNNVEGALFPAFSVEVLPLDSEVLDFVAGALTVVPEEEPGRPTVDANTNVLASPIKPNEKSSTGGSKGSRLRSRSLLSSEPSTSATTVFGASPAPRARTFAHPYALSRSTSVQDVGINGLSRATGSQPLLRSHSINGPGTSLDDAMANRDRGIASSMASRAHRTPGPKQASDIGNIRSLERPSTATTSDALQRALENGLDDQDDAVLKSPSDGASASRRSHHREPAFASPAMIKSASRNMVFGSIPEAGGMAPSPSRSAPVAIVKKPAASKPLSRQGSRASAAKKDRVRASVPKPITIHPAHQLGELAVEIAGVDYPTPTYSTPSHMARSQSARQAFQQAPEPSQQAMSHPHSSQFPQSAQFQSSHLENPIQYGQPRYTIPHPQQHLVMHPGKQYAEYEEHRMACQPLPAQQAPNTFVVPVPEDPNARTHHQIGYSPREANRSQMRQNQGQAGQQAHYIGTPGSQYFEAQAERSQGQPVQQDPEGSRFQHHSPYLNVRMVNQQTYQTQPTHYYHSEAPNQADTVQCTGGAMGVNDYSQWPVHQQSAVGLGLDEFPGTTWDGAMYDTQAMQGMMQQQQPMQYGL